MTAPSISIKSLGTPITIYGTAVFTTKLFAMCCWLVLTCGRRSGLPLSPLLRQLECTSVTAGFHEIQSPRAQNKVSSSLKKHASSVTTMHIRGLEDPGLNMMRLSRGNATCASRLGSWKSAVPLTKAPATTDLRHAPQHRRLLGE